MKLVRLMLLAAAVCLSGAARSSFSMLAAAPPEHVSVTVFPARVEPDVPRAAFDSFSPYIGRVRTLPVGLPLSAMGPMTYDADDDVILFITGAGNQYGLFKLAPTGSLTYLTSFNPLPWGMVYDHATRDVYITAPDDHAVYVTSVATGQTTLLAGGTFGTKDGQGAAAQFQQPGGIGLDIRNGDLYVADHDRIRTVTVGGLVTTLTAPGSIGNGTYNCGQFPDGVAYDIFHKRLDVTDTCLNVIHAVDPATGAVATLGGSCIQLFGNPGCVPLQRDGSLANALFAQPSGIIYDPFGGDLLIADVANNQIREISSAGTVSTLAGSGHALFRDGLGTVAELNQPYALCLRRSMLLYVADGGNAAIRTVTTRGTTPPPPPHGIVLIDPPSPASGPAGIVATSDGSIWFTEGNISKIARRLPDGTFQEFALPSQTYPQKLVLGGDGDFWFEGYGYPDGIQQRAIGTMTPSGSVTIYPVPQFMWYDNFPQWSIDVGPDGNIWFADARTAVIGNVTPTGQYTWYQVAPASTITSGFQGDLWTNGGLQNIGGMSDYTTAGNLIKTHLNVGGFSIARGPNGHMWWVVSDFVGELRGNRSIEYALPKPRCCSEWDPATLIAGADGAIWMPMYVAGYLGRITTTGRFEAWEIPAPRSDPLSVTVAPDGTTWFADPGADKIGYYH